MNNNKISKIAKGYCLESELELQKIYEKKPDVMKKLNEICENRYGKDYNSANTTRLQQAICWKIYCFSKLI